MDRTSSRPDCPVPSAERRVATSLPAPSRYTSEISHPSPLRAGHHAVDLGRLALALMIWLRTMIPEGAVTASFCPA
jgi:hypothetical protein